MLERQGLQQSELTAELTPPGAADSRPLSRPAPSQPALFDRSCHIYVVSVVVVSAPQCQQWLLPDREAR